MNTIATTSHRQPVHPKPQTAAATADGERDHRRQCQSPYRAVGGRAQRCADRLPRRHEPLPQLQLWQHSRNCTAEAGRNPRGWPLCMEPARPQGEERRERHPHSRSHHRHQAQDRRRGRERHPAYQNKPFWLASATPMSSMSRRPKARSFQPCTRSRAMWARTATVCLPSSSVRASSLSLPRTSRQRWA